VICFVVNTQEAVEHERSVGKHETKSRKSVTTLHEVFVWAINYFNENIAYHKQKQFNICFQSLFYFLSIISSFVANLIYRSTIFVYFVACFAGGNLAKLGILGFHVTSEKTEFKDFKFLPLSGESYF